MPTAGIKKTKMLKTKLCFVVTILSNKLNCMTVLVVTRKPLYLPTSGNVPSATVKNNGKTVLS